MEMLYKLILITHISAGFVALSLFWLQAYSVKGNRRHRRVGNLYVKLMWIVVISAMLLCIISVVDGRYAIASFLLFLALITAKPLWLGVAILKAKNTQSGGQRTKYLRRYRIASVMINFLIVLAGLVMIFYGLYIGGQGIAALLVIFGGLGVINVFELRASLKAFGSSDLSDWVKEHIVSMGTSGIAAHTAFLVFGANRLLPAAITQSYWSFLPWLAPAVIGTALIRYAVRRYQPKNSVTPLATTH